MSPMTRRRSSRLNSNATPSKSFASKLGSLFERENDTPKQETSLNAMVESPAHSRMPGSFDDDESLLKTPRTSDHMKPAHEEMHPSKVQQSTKRAPDSGLRLGFTDINKKETVSAQTVDSTPSKSKLQASSGFDFRWGNDESELGIEAQRIMESVREEAAKIKEQMLLQRNEQALKDEEADQMSNILGGRKIAKPKPGRFSDAHKAEFNKMDSIADHVSAWKNKVQASAPKVNLKRTQSRANISGPTIQVPTESDRLENTSPGKRVKTRFNDDVSSTRPGSSGTVSSIPRVSRATVPGAAGRPVSRDGAMRPSALPSGVTTPTKSSLARAISVQSLRGSKLPSLSRSKSSKELTSPSPQKTDGGNKFLSALSRAPSMKSILHKAQPKHSNDPLKIAAGTHLPIPNPSNKTGTEIRSSSLLDTSTPILNRSPAMKRVGFSLKAKDSGELGANPSSPTKIPAAPSLHEKASVELGSRVAKSSKIPSAPSSRTLAGSPSKLEAKVSYPELRKPLPSGLNSHPPTPGDFTFRSTRPINFGPATSGIASPTIRHVRPSGIATPTSAFDGMPTVPHGIANKKRRRADDDDDDEDTENVPPGYGTAGGSPLKKQKNGASIGSSSANNTSTEDGRRKQVGKFMADKSKRVGMSMARLNALARPKARR